MAGPKTPRELADRLRDHRAQHRARDGFVRETFTQPRDDARQTVREFLDRLPEAGTAQLPHAKLHRVLTREDDHGNLCRAYEVHRPRNPQR
jgi:hypothetical protein